MDGVISAEGRKEAPQTRSDTEILEGEIKVLDGDTATQGDDVQGQDGLFLTIGSPNRHQVLIVIVRLRYALSVVVFHDGCFLVVIAACFVKTSETEPVKARVLILVCFVTKVHKLILIKGFVIRFNKGNMGMLHP